MGGLVSKAKKASLAVVGIKPNKSNYKKAPGGGRVRNFGDAGSATRRAYRSGSTNNISDELLG